MLATELEVDLKAPFSTVTTPKCTRGRYFFPVLLHITLDQCLIMPRLKQG